MSFLEPAKVIMDIEDCRKAAEYYLSSENYELYKTKIDKLKNFVWSDFPEFFVKGKTSVK